MEQISNTRQATWVALGSFFSFIVGIASPMILSRYFDKGDYGTYKQVMYVYNTLLAVFTLGLPKAYAYFLPKYSDKYSKDIINKITRLFLILGCIFSFVLFVGAGIVADILKNPDLKEAIMIFSPTPLLLLPTMGLDGIYASFKKTKALAYYTIATKIITIICIILPVVIFNGNYIHAIIGFDFASLITCIIALYLKTWPVRGVQMQEKSNLELIQVLSFSLPLLYASLWGMIIASANQFFISRFYGNEVFAEFSNGFMEIPFAMMILGAVGAILLPVFSGMDKGTGMNKEAIELWNSALIKSAKIIFPILVFSIIYAKLFMICMYGECYENSAIYFIIKNVSGLFYIIPFAPIILAIGKTKVYAHVHMFMAFAIIMSEWLVVKLFDSAIYVAIVSECCQILKIYLLMRVISNYASKSIKEMIPSKTLIHILLVSISSALCSYFFITLFQINKYLEFILGLIIFGLTYYVICWITRLSYRNIAVSFVLNPRFQRILKYIP